MLTEVPGYPRWQADENGRVYKDGQEIFGHYDEGYVRVGKFGIRRAKLVCLAFHGLKPFAKAEVCHFNDIRDDDRPSNLRWDTHKSNSADAVRNGKMSKAKGQDSCRAKISNDEVAKMRKDYDNGMTRADLATSYGISWTQVNKIVQGKVRVECP